MQDPAGTTESGALSDARKTGKIALVVTSDLLRLDRRIRFWILCAMLRKLNEDYPAEIDDLIEFINNSLPRPPHDNRYEELEGMLPP